MNKSLQVKTVEITCLWATSNKKSGLNQKNTSVITEEQYIYSERIEGDYPSTTLKRKKSEKSSFSTKKKMQPQHPNWFFLADVNIELNPPGMLFCLMKSFHM